MNLYFITIVLVICFFALVSLIWNIAKLYNIRKLTEATLLLAKNGSGKEEIDKILETIKKK